MKKRILSLICILLFGAALMGCSSLANLFGSSATATTDSETNVGGLSDSELAALVQVIYDQVVSQVSDATYQQIYDAVVSDIESQIADGTITVSADSVQEAVLKILNQAKDAIIGVTNVDGSSLGSGVIFQEIDGVYYVITNYHVVEGGTEFQIEFSDGETAEGTLLGYDSEVDIALLSFHGDTVSASISVAPLGDSDSLSEGSFVIAIGNPEGYDYYGSVTFGIVSGVDRVVDSDYFIGYIQHDAAINGGNSGGALFDLDGNVIGINTLKFSDTAIEGMGFAIPINLVKEVIDHIFSGEDGSIKPVLGTTVLDVGSNQVDGMVTITSTSTVSSRWPGSPTQTVTTETDYALPSGVTEGLFVYSVTDGSAASGILEVGDVVVSIDDYEITDYEAYMKYFYSQYRSGDVISLTFYEWDGSAYSSTPTTLTVVLG